jgi:hypothetical protein
MSGAVAAVKPSRRWTWAMPILTLLAGAAIGTLFGATARAPEPETRPTLRRVSFRRGSIVNARFAPDGQTIVYAGAFARDPIRLYSTRGQRDPTGWEVIGTLARVSLGGGAPREILEDVLEADWSPDGRQLAVVRDRTGMRRLEYPIGTELYATAGYFIHIRVSRDGDHIAFLDHPVRGDKAGTIAIVNTSKCWTWPPDAARRGENWLPPTLPA